MRIIIALLIALSTSTAFAATSTYNCVDHSDFSFHVLEVVDGLPNSLDGQPLPRYYDFLTGMGVNGDGLMLYFISEFTGLYSEEFYCKPRP